MAAKRKTRKSRTQPRPKYRNPVFYLDRPRFESEVRPHLTFAPTALAQFATVLPFNMAIAPAFSLLTSLDEESAAHLLITRVPVSLRFPAGAVVSGKIDLPETRTKLELTYISEYEVYLSEQSEFQDEHLAFLNFALSACIETANQIILAYQLITGDDRPRRLSLEALESLSFARIVPLPEWDNLLTGIYVHRKDPILPPADLDEKTTDQLSDLFLQVAVEPNAIFIAEEIALAASQHLRYGRWAESVIYSQVSVETMLRALIGSLIDEETADKKEDEEDEPFQSLKALVRGEFHHRLGGDWNLDNQNGPVGRWWQQTYMLRNRIAHTGHIPSAEAAKRALEAAEEFRHWLAERVGKKARKYPRTREFVQAIYSNLP